MGSRRVLPIAFALLMGVPALAQGPTYGIGRTPTAEEIRALGHLHRSDRRGTSAGKRKRQGRRAAVSHEGMRGMPRRDGHRRHGAHSEKQGSRESRRLGAGTNPAASRAVRDDGLGLHQSRHAAQSERER